MICSAPEERLPMILSVLEKAGVVIDGMEELEEWRALKDQSYLIDIREFVGELISDKTIQAAEREGEMLIKPKDFNDFCRQRNLKPSCCKRMLNQKGYLKTCLDGEKLNYTVSIWKDGKCQRFIVIKVFSDKKARW